MLTDKIATLLVSDILTFGIFHSLTLLYCGKILDAILTHQEYSRLKYKIPYILDFKKNNQEMLYIGVEHSRDYNAKQYSEIESLFEKFLKQYPSDTIIIAIENFIPSAQKSKNDSIVSYGESGF